MYKKTLQRRTLKGRTPQTCLLEALFTMLGLWLLGLMSLDAITCTKRHPRDWSVARSRDAGRRGIRNAQPRGRERPNLTRDLAAAVKDTYQRSGCKAARNYPRKKIENPPAPRKSNRQPKPKSNKSNAFAQKRSP